MEAEGCRKALNSVLANNVHVTITSEMRKKYPGVKYQYDVWHLAKWMVKKLTLKAKKKGQDLLPWIQSSPTISGGEYQRAMEIVMSLEKSGHQ